MSKDSNANELLGGWGAIRVWEEDTSLGGRVHVSVPYDSRSLYVAIEAMAAHLLDSDPSSTLGRKRKYISDNIYTVREGPGWIEFAEA